MQYYSHIFVCMGIIYMLPHNLIIVICSSIIIISIIIILKKYRKDNNSKRYYELQDLDVNIGSIKKYDRDISKELNNLIGNKDWIEWPEKELYGNDGWNIIPIYGFNIWNKKFMRLCPETTKFLRSIPTLRTALFSKLKANTRLEEHQGWAKLANYVLRCHYPLIVPKDGECYMMVEGEKRLHKEREWLIFDDSKKHYAVNDTDDDRYILLIDVGRPDNIPKGKSKINNTYKLDKLISYFTKQNN